MMRAARTPRGACRGRGRYDRRCRALRSEARGSGGFLRELLAGVSGGMGAEGGDIDAEERLAASVARGAQAPPYALTLRLFERDPRGGALRAADAAALPTAELGFDVRFEPPEGGVYPPRGRAAVAGSRFFSGGSWRVDEAGYFKFTLRCCSAVRAGGVTIVAEGDAVYFNAKAEAGRGALDAPSLTSGVATVKQAIKSSFLGADFSGIQAQYVVVGTFAASPSE